VFVVEVTSVEGVDELLDGLEVEEVESAVVWAVVSSASDPCVASAPKELVRSITLSKSLGANVAVVTSPFALVKVRVTAPVGTRPAIGGPPKEMMAVFESGLRSLRGVKVRDVMAKKWNFDFRNLEDHVLNWEWPG
jgi:hypothetical protein